MSKNLRSSLTETDFGAIKTIAPTYTEQVEIADYLDRKCAEIDKLIEALNEARYVADVLNKRYAKPNLDTKPDTVEISTKAFYDLSTPENIVKTSKNVLGEAWNVNLNPTNQFISLVILYVTPL